MRQGPLLGQILSARGQNHMQLNVLYEIEAKNNAEGMHQVSMTSQEAHNHPHSISIK